MQNEISNHGNGGMTFAGPKGVGVYQAHAIASALRFYAKTGMKVNRAYTPTNMLKTASRLTGKTFKRGQYEEAAAALTELAQRLSAEVHAENN